MKICSNKKCFLAGQLQLLENFHKDKSTKDGFRYLCTVCVKGYLCGYYQTNQENLLKHQKQYYQENKKEILEYQKKYGQINEEKISVHQKQYYQENKKEILSKTKKYRETHKEQRSAQTRRRRKDDIGFRVEHNLRTRLQKAVKYSFKSGSAVRALALDCSIEELRKNRLEPMFVFMFEENEMMTWENYGRLWHIDHIIPLSAFDLTDPEQVKKACHYTNLRPMHWKQNISERDRGMSLNKNKRSMK